MDGLLATLHTDGSPWSALVRLFPNTPDDHPTAEKLQRARLVTIAIIKVMQSLAANLQVFLSVSDSAHLIRDPLLTKQYREGKKMGREVLADLVEPPGWTEAQRALVPDLVEPYQAARRELLTIIPQVQKVVTDDLEQTRAERLATVQRRVLIDHAESFRRLAQ